MATSWPACLLCSLLRICITWLCAIKVGIAIRFVQMGEPDSHSRTMAGTRLQKRIFLLCIYGSITFLLRAIDIKSYDHVLPRAVTNFLSWSCTDTLITILYVALCRLNVSPLVELLMLCFS